MTLIYDEPERFAQSASKASATSTPISCTPCAAGAVRATETPRGKVALVIGGGSGHYPAFGGYVGIGLADATVAGDVFASPSTESVARICRQAHRGGGIVLGFGNYAGDVLNFGAAATRLRGEGIDVRVLAVTDDVASAPKETRELRRGVAGDVPVFKIAGAAAEAGMTLDEVERLARLANARTQSFGIAFSGCTLPGADAPLFTVEKGPSRSASASTASRASATRRRCRRRPSPTSSSIRCSPSAPPVRAGASPCSSTGSAPRKYEELFVLWTHVARRLRDAGLTLVQPEVGEFVTSLDMAGCSLTITWLDGELEPLWLAPAHGAAFRRGNVEARAAAPKPSKAMRKPCRSQRRRTPPDRTRPRPAPSSSGLPPCWRRPRRNSAASMRWPATVTTGRACVAVRPRLPRARARRSPPGRARVRFSPMPATAGRHGRRHVRRDLGSSPARLRHGARRRRCRGCGRSGPRRAAGRDAVTTLGRARVGDKTLVDALVPFVETLDAEVKGGARLRDAWSRAAEAATRAADETARLTPRLGRARPLAAKSIGHPDAGAVSLALCARTVGEALNAG